MRRGLVIGGGGTLGLAWSVGALAAVEEALDWDARSATVLVGSGCGAEIAAVLGAGYTTRDMVRALTGHPGAPRLLAEQFASERHVLPSVPIPAPSSLGLAFAGLRRKVPATSVLSALMPVGTGSFDRIVDFGRTLAQISSGRQDGWVAHPQTWVVAAGRGDGARVPFGLRGAPTTDLGTALAAATARPGWFPPVRIGSTAYVEASVASPTSADLVLPMQLDEVVVLAPTSSKDAGLGFGISMIERLLRRGTTMRLDLEEAALMADGTRVIRVEPGPEDLSALGVNPMDHRRRREVVVTSLTTSPERVALAVQRSGSGLLEPTLARPERARRSAVETQQFKALPAGRLMLDERRDDEVPEAWPDEPTDEVTEPATADAEQPAPTAWRRLRRWFASGRRAA